MRYAVTGDPEAKRTASRFFSGIALLNNVTGKKGLMARSCCSPEDVTASMQIQGEETLSYSEEP